MFCPNCGSYVADDCAFCGNCGSAVPRSLVNESGRYSPVELKSDPQRVWAVPSSRWPVIAGILMSFALMLFAFHTYFYLRFFNSIFEMFKETSFGVYLFSYLTATVLFFAPTRRVAAVTSIPRWIIVAYQLYLLVKHREFGGDDFVSSFINFQLILIPVILYTIGTAVRPRSSALAVVHLIMTVLVLCYSIYRNLEYYKYLVKYEDMEWLLSLLSQVFAGAAYSVALFFTQKRLVYQN